MLMLVVGPSGAGKDTLLNAARDGLAGDASIRFARREITRAATEGGEDHLPIDTATYTARRDAGAYALWWEAHGLCYGISADITADLARGIAVIASVSRAVIVEAASRFPVRVIEITASPEILAERLNNRAREDANAIAARLARQVALPEHLEIIRIFNDTTIEAGAAQLRQALRR